MSTDFDSCIRHRDELVIQPLFLPLCYQWRVQWYPSDGSLSWRWFETKPAARAFAEKVYQSDGEFGVEEMAKAVGGCAAVQEHDARVAENKGLHGDQLKNVQRYARLLRAAANKLRP